MLDALYADVQAMASPERAKTNAWYFKTGPGQYGEGDRFAGLTLPQVRALAKKYRDLDLELTATLLSSPLHEERLLALLIFVGRFKKAGADEREHIYRLYLANTRYINSWDLVDASAEHIVGAYLGDDWGDVLKHLARSSSVWERRIAMLATFYYIRRGDPRPALGIAALLVDDRHDLVQKAVGWMLREAGKRCGDEHLRPFLDQHAATMPRTALRYAVERLPAGERQRYLAMRSATSRTRVTALEGKVQSGPRGASAG